MLHYFCEVKFKSDHNLQTALDLTRVCLINDTQMPVRVEAAIALQVLISNQEKGALWMIIFFCMCILVKEARVPKAQFLTLLYDSIDFI